MLWTHEPGRKSGEHGHGSTKAQKHGKHGSCCKPSNQPRDAARREECSNLDEKSLTIFYRCDGRAKGIAREHQNGFYET